MFLADVHSHILCGVDDGAENESVMYKMLDKAYENGVRALCATPHYNPELFPHEKAEEDAAFESLTAYAAEKYPDLRLYRGNEIYVFSGVPSIISEVRGGFIADGENVLMEFPVNAAFQDISETVSGVVSLGFIPVIAHIERYKNVGKKEALILKQSGAKVTVNAESIVGINGFSEKIKVKKLIKHGIADIVSSDAHASRAYDVFNEAKELILKKHGESIALPLFWSNANKLFTKETR